MLTDAGSATQAEDAATIAWNDYAEAAQRARASWDVPGTTSADRRWRYEHALEAHRRFEAAYRLLDQPTPPNKQHTRNRLACEGVLLVSALAAFVGLFLPDLEAHLWSLTLTFGAAGLLTAWSYRFTGRLAAQLGGRS